MPRTAPRWAELVESLDLPEDGCNITDLVDRVARHRGRPIRLEPLTACVGYTGSVARRDGHDLIQYELDGGPTHQAWSVCHELSHLLLDHAPDRAADGDLVADPTGGQLQMLAELGTAELILCRTSFDSEPEAEAETLAWVLLERTGQRHDVTGGALASALAPRRRRRR